MQPLFLLRKLKFLPNKLTHLKEKKITLPQRGKRYLHIYTPLAHIKTIHYLAYC